ncbi:MAG: BGTF surface domain-containing protein, partial [Halodesulfurarchaeum sp.]
MVGPLENGAVRPGTTLETALRLTEESAVIPTRANGTATDSRNASIDVVEATATLDGVSPNGTLDLPVNASIGVRGTTTVAPGTTATVHLRGRNDTFVYEKQTTVSEDGTYEADLDVSDRKDGETYTVSVTADGEQLSRVRTGEFVGGTADEAAVSQGGGG